MRSVALYSPYFPKHFGGGERYLLSIAECCSLTSAVSILVPQSVVQEARANLPKYSSLFGLNLSKVSIQPTVIGIGRNPIQSALETRKFDTFFVITDGSIIPTLCPKSYFIVQIPWTRSLTLSEQVKLRGYKKILVYSQFVESILQKSWKSNRVETLAPYVDTRDFVPVPLDLKEKLILNVGRFFSHQQSNSKRQDVLVSAFGKMLGQARLRGWHLALVGNVDPSPDSEAYLNSLRELSRGLPVSIHTNLQYDELRAYYARASIYWHAAGFGVDETKNPENTEHFGITTLEAMASGCIPFVVPKGGQREIVASEDFFWNSEAELASKTIGCVHTLTSKQAHWQQASSHFVALANEYSKSRFEQAIQSLL